MSYNETHINTPTQDLSLTFDKVFVIGENGEKIQIKHETIYFDSLNMYGEPMKESHQNYFKELNLTNELKKVINRDDDIEKAIKKGFSFYVSRGKINNWDNFISYDLYLNKNDVKIELLEKDIKSTFGDDEIKTEDKYKIVFLGGALSVTDCHFLFLRDNANYRDSYRKLESLEEEIEKLKSKDSYFNPKFNKERAIKFHEEKIAQGYKYRVFEYFDKFTQEIEIFTNRRFEPTPEQKERNKQIEKITKDGFIKLDHYQLNTLLKHYKITKIRK